MGSGIPECAPVFCTGPTSSIPEFPVEGPSFGRSATQSKTRFDFSPSSPRGYGLSQTTRNCEANI